MVSSTAITFTLLFLGVDVIAAGSDQEGTADLDFLHGHQVKGEDYRHTRGDERPK